MAYLKLSVQSQSLCLYPLIELVCSTLFFASHLYSLLSIATIPSSGEALTTLTRTIITVSSHGSSSLRNSAQSTHVFESTPCSKKLCRFHIVQRKWKINTFLCLHIKVLQSLALMNLSFFISHCKYLSSFLFCLHPKLLILAVPFYFPNMFCIPCL